MNSFVGGPTRGSMFRGNVGFTPRWMAMNPRTYAKKSDHKGVMATNRCGRDDLIGVQKKEQGQNVPSMLMSRPTPPTVAASTTVPSPPQQESSSMRGMTSEQKRVKRKRDLLLSHLSDLDTPKEKEKRRKMETDVLEKRCVPMSYLFKPPNPQ